MKNSGLFLNMAKWCFFWGLFFWGVNIKRFDFGMSGFVSKVFKMLVFFPVLGGLSGLAHCCSSGFGRFRCFCVSCVCFSFLCCFCFCLFALFLVLWLDVVVLFFLLFFWCFFFLCLSLFLFSLVSLSPFSVSLSLSFFVSLLFFSCFLRFCFSFLFLVLAFPFCFVCFLILSCSLVSVVLLVILLCFESQYFICFCFASFVFLLFLFFVLFALFFFCIFWFWETNQKTSLKKMEIEKNSKNEKCRKKRTFWQEQLAQLCSQIVSFFLFCVSLNFAFLAENTIKIGVSPPPPKKKNKNNKFYKFKTGPSIS